MIPWEWITPLLLISVYGFFAYRAASRDRTRRPVQWEWWRSKPELAWWAEREPRKRLSRKHEIQIGRKK